MISRLKQFIAFAKRKPIEAAFIATCFGVVFLHGSTKPPVVQEKGITITKCETTPQKIDLKWEAEDDRIEAGTAIFIIEARERPIKLGNRTVFEPTNTEWYEIGRTTDFEISRAGFWVDKTREIRVRTVIEGE